MDKQFFYELADKYLNGTATAQEKQLVEAYYEELSKEELQLSPEKKQLLQEQLYNNVQKAIHKPATVVPMRLFLPWLTEVK